MQQIEQQNGSEEEKQSMHAERTRETAQDQHTQIKKKINRKNRHTANIREQEADLQDTQDNERTDAEERAMQKLQEENEQ